MSNRYEGVKCPVCSGYLFEDADDIVVCPICGAPHHRACYLTLGHCGEEALHGTEKQYDKVQKEKAYAHAKSEKENALICSHCGKALSSDMLFCPHCGSMRGEAARPEQEQKHRFFLNSMDPLGGIHPSTDLGEGVTAKQAAQFVKVNTTRYIPKFASPSKTSWNWLAFLLPHSFFFYHKMYKQGILASLIYLAAMILQLPMQAEMIQVMSGMPVNANFMDFFAATMQNGFIVSSSAMWLYAGALLLLLLLRIFSGIFADYWYKCHVIRMVKKLEPLEPEMREEQYIKKGLPNPYFLLFATLIFSWLPNVLYIMFF